MNKLLLVLFVSLIYLPLSQTVVAQEAEKKALAKAQFLLRQVNAEKASLQQQLDALRQEFEEYKQSSQSELTKSESRQRKTSATLGKWQESHGKLKDVLQSKLVELAQEKQYNALLIENYDKRTENFDICHKNNQELVRVNSELVDYYQDKKSFFKRLQEREPVTGIASVKAENIVQDYEHEIEDFSLRENAFLLSPINEDLVVQYQEHRQRLDSQALDQ